MLALHTTQQQELVATKTKPLLVSQQGFAFLEAWQ